MNKMKAKKESDLVTAVREMAAHYRGEISLQTRTVHVPKTIDVVAIRRNFGLTQKQFAEHYGFSLSAIREWEQGRRYPSGPACSLLRIAQKHPEVFIDL